MKNNLIHILIVISLVVLATVLLSTTSSGSGYTKYIVTGTVRCCNNGNHYVLNNSGHLPTNMSATSSGKNIVVRYPTAEKVGSLLVVTDETLASKGWDLGASVGKSSSGIRCYRNGLRQDCRKMGQWPLSNVWVYGVMYR